MVQWQIAHVAALSAWVWKEGSTSFFQKKEAKKLSLLWVVAPPKPQPTGTESFLLLFFKKEALASFLGTGIEKLARTAARNCPEFDFFAEIAMNLAMIGVFS